MEIIVKPVSKADIPILLTIANEAVRQSVEASTSEKERLLVRICSDIEKYSGNSKSVYLQATCDRVCGYVLVKEYWNLAHLFVLPDVQRLGVGKLLLQQALKICRDKGDKGFVRVNSSLNAKGFYMSQGFVPFDETELSPDIVVPLVCHFSGGVRK